MGTPLFKIRPLVEQHNIRVFSTNFTLYHDMSRRVMSFIARCGYLQEVYSVDECFLLLPDESSIHPKDFARALRDSLYRGVGIPTSIGIAPTKTLAKAACYYAKRYPGYEWVAMMEGDAQREAALQQLPIGEVWGVGKRYEAKLLHFGIRTALDFYNAPLGWVHHSFNKSLADTWRELHGEQAIPFAQNTTRKSITASRSLAVESDDPAILRHCLSSFLMKCCRTLQREQLRARQLGIFLSTNRFKIDTIQHTAFEKMRLPFESNSELELNTHVLQLFDRVVRPECRYQKVGVWLGELKPRGHLVNLFHQQDEEKYSKVSTVLRELVDWQGNSSIRLGSMLPRGEGQDLVRKDHLSQEYTTSLNDIIEIYV